MLAKIIPSSPRSARVRIRKNVLVVLLWGSIVSKVVCVIADRSKHDICHWERLVNKVSSMADSGQHSVQLASLGEATVEGGSTPCQLSYLHGPVACQKLQHSIQPCPAYLFLQLGLEIEHNFQTQLHPSPCTEEEPKALQGSAKIWCHR